MENKTNSKEEKGKNRFMQTMGKICGKVKKFFAKLFKNKTFKIIFIIVIIIIAIILIHLIKNYVIMKKINKLSYDKSNSINFHIKRTTTMDKDGYFYETDGYCLNTDYKSVVKRDNKTYTFIKVKYGGIMFTEDGVNKTAKIYNSVSSGNYMHPVDYAFRDQLKNGFKSSIFIRYTNGNTYYVITSSKLSTYDYGDDIKKVELYINTKTGLADKIIETKNDGEVTRYEYEYEFDNVTNDDVASPDIAKYKFEE